MSESILGTHKVFFEQKKELCSFANLNNAFKTSSDWHRVGYFNTMHATVYSFASFQSHFLQILELQGFDSTAMLYIGHNLD